MWGLALGMFLLVRTVLNMDYRPSMVPIKDWYKGEHPNQFNPTILHNLLKTGALRIGIRFWGLITGIISKQGPDRNTTSSSYSDPKWGVCENMGPRILFPLAGFPYIKGPKKVPLNSETLNPKP